MGIASLIMSVAGLVLTLVHYATHSIVLGVVDLIVLTVSLVTGILDIQKKNKNGGIDYNMLQPGVLGHGISGIVLLLGGIMCVMAVVGKYPANIM